MATKPAILSPDLTMEQLFMEWIQVIPVFMRLRMACVGCPMLPFETLETVAKIYGLPPDELRNELEAAIASGTQ
jgi:hybrid cluster-associated redox disulfide protein